MTCVSGSKDWPEEDRTTLIKKIKNTLGTGASFDGEDIVVQGEHIDRLKIFFDKESIAFN